MTVNKHWRWVALAITLLILFAVVSFSLYKEANGCMSVPIKSADILESMSETDYDYSQNIYFNNNRCAVDRTTKTVYISQDIDESSTNKSLSGKLELKIPGYFMYFIDNGTFDNLDLTVSAGGTLRLIIVNPLNQYTEYKVVLTTLPVILLEGEESHLDEDGRAVNFGKICI